MAGFIEGFTTVKGLNEGINAKNLTPKKWIGYIYCTFNHDRYRNFSEGNRAPTCYVTKGKGTLYTTGKDAD